MNLPALRDHEAPELMSRLRSLLDAAKTLSDAMHVRSTAQAVEKFLRGALASGKCAKEAADVRLRAERVAGEILMNRDFAKRGGDRKTKNQYESLLKDFGIDDHQSSRWQQIARVPQDIFDNYIAKCWKDDADITTEGLFRFAKEQEREEQREKNRILVGQTEPIDQTEQAFPAIVIDPPWDWNDEGDVDQMGRAQPTYATMPIEEITQLPIGALSQDNAHLYLWITNRSLPKGFDLLDAWGFRYVTMLTWVKPSFGMGNYFRGSTEHVLFGVKGSLPLLRRDAGTHFTAPRPGPHSGKPDEFYTLVETCSPGPWLELFARQTRPGWVSRGAEVGHTE